MSVPIQALTVREMLYDDKGELVREPPHAPPAVGSERRDRPARRSNEPPPGHTRKETEGVFVVRDGKAVFTPVKVGIAGEQYFEVLDGPEGRRPGHHRPVRLGARAGRRTGGQGCSRRTAASRQPRPHDQQT